MSGICKIKDKTMNKKVFTNKLKANQHNFLKCPRCQTMKHIKPKISNLGNISCFSCRYKDKQHKWMTFNEYLKIQKEIKI